MGFCNFRDVLISVWVIDFVQGDDGWELDIYESRNDGGDGRRLPGFERSFQGQSVEGTGNCSSGGAVARELVLETVNRRSF